MRVDTVVIGAGPAGLAAAAALKRRGVDPFVLERGGAVGAAWRTRYDRLRLHTARSLSGLPWHGIPKRHGRWVPRDALVAYLEEYAQRFGIEPQTNTEVRRIDRADGGWRIATSRGDIDARAVVVAIGHSNVPYLPGWPGRFDGTLIHSSEYTTASAYGATDALVVGCGNSGAEIAVDLADAGARVEVAVRTPPAIFRRDTAGIPNQPIAIVLWRLPTPVVDPIAKALRRLTVPDLTAYGLPTPAAGPYSDYLARGVVPIVDVGFVKAVKERRLEIVPTVERFENRDVVLADGTRTQPDLIVAATGYRTGLEPLVGHLGVLNARGEPTRHAGHTHAQAPNLHFIGYTTSLGGLLRRLPGEARRVAQEVARGTQSE